MVGRRGPGARARALCVVAGTVLLWSMGCRREEDFTLLPVQEAPELQAPLASGEVFRLSEHRGKVVLLSFGYTGCPDVCPTTLSRLQSLHGWLGTAARDVEVLFVSVDPERDSASQLETYVHAFNPRFTGLHLEGEALKTALAGYHVTAVRRYPDASRYREHPLSGDIAYSVDHTGAYFLIDKRGQLRARLPYSTSVEQLQAAVERLLAEDGGPTSHVRVEKAQARLTPAHVGAIYFTLVNHHGQDDRLLSAESTAGRVELHESLARGEVLQMQPRPEGFVIPAQGRVELKPGGKHLMLYDLQGAMDSLPLTLHFEKAGPVHLSVPVSSPGADEP